MLATGPAKGGGVSACGGARQSFRGGFGQAGGTGALDTRSLLVHGLDDIFFHWATISNVAIEFELAMNSVCFGWEKVVSRALNHCSLSER